MYPGFISRWTSAAESAYVRSVRKKHNSTRVDDGRELNSSRDRNARRFRRPIASDQADFFAHTMECVQPTLLVGCRAAARSPRALTGTNCCDLERIDWQTPILVILNSRTAFISGIQEVQGGFLMRPFSAYKAKKPLHTGLRTGCHYLISLCPSVCLSVCVTFVVFTDCENYTGWFRLNAQNCVPD